MDHLGHLRGLTGNFGRAAVRQRQRRQLRLQFTGKQGGVVPLGGLTGHADHAGAVLTRNGRIGVAVRAGGELCQRVSLVHGIAVIIGGRCGKLHLEQVIEIRCIGLIHNGHSVSFAAHL